MNNRIAEDRPSRQPSERRFVQAMSGLSLTSYDFMQP
jgi:hypothetical protein